MLPLIAMCDRWDIGGLSTNVHFQTGRSTIFIYDGHPGGVGITLRGYEQFERLLGDAERLIAECPCESGCPSCVQSPKCGNLNEPLHKEGALELMGLMRGSCKRADSLFLLAAARIRNRRSCGQGQSWRRARIAKAWDQASGVVERGMPVCGVDALGEVAGRRGRAAQRLHQPQRLAPLAERGERPGGPGGGSGPGVLAAGPAFAGGDAEGGALGDEAIQRGASGGVEAGLGEGTHRPGRGRVEARIRVARLAHQVEAAIFPPYRWVNADTSPEARALPR